MKCERCGRDDLVSCCSYFNTQQICGECEDRERDHPDYEKAKQAECEAVARGDCNFPGIGLPADLR